MIRISRFVLALELLLVAAGASTPARANARPRSEGLAEAVDAYVASLRRLEVFDGVVLIARGDHILLERAYGMANREHRVPMRSDHVFRIASISKLFTQVLVGRLLDRGTVALDDSIARWLPSFAEARRITVRDLLEHRAGISNQNSLPYDEEALGPNTLAMLVDSLGRRPLDFAPGTSERYSNGNYAVLARVIEQATGLAYAAALEREILQPLRLRRTQHESDGDVIEGMTSGYMPSPTLWGVMIRAPFQEMATKTGGGSLVSTAHDLFHWARAIGHSDLLRPATWAQLFPGNDSLVSMSGRCPGYNVALRRESGVVAVVLLNNYDGGMAGDVAKGLIALASGRRPAPLPVRVPVDLAASVAAACVGTYRPADGDGPFPPGTLLQVRSSSGALVLDAGGIPVDVLVPQGGRSFLLRQMWSRVTFYDSTASSVAGMEVHALYKPSVFRAPRLAVTP